MPRPRRDVDEHAIITAYENGQPIAELARNHHVDRYVIRRVLDDHGIHRIEHRGAHWATKRAASNIIDFPRQPAAPPPGTVTSADLITTAGITYRRADMWTRTGRLRTLPRQPDEGSGVPRYYPASEVPVATLMARLTDAGLAVQAAHDTARALLEHGTTLLAGIRVDLPHDI